jgi:diadenosine tetraphosphate (Ap4A) HIT family hydrolase
VEYDTLEQARLEGRAPWSDLFLDTRDFAVFKDKYPVTEGHLLFVPKTANEQHLMRCFRMANEVGVQNIQADNDITGFNIGLNVGRSAGQTYMYPHIHLIFRRDGDCADPTGGIRNVIPHKANYKKGDTNA